LTLEQPQDSIAEVPRLVRELYAVVAQFERLFPGRKFTPDGHLVGSIGEVIAQHRYGLKLLANSHQLHDAECPLGRKVQIKATQGKRVALRGQPEHLIVLLLDQTGQAHEIFNGPGAMVWALCGGKLQSNGQSPVSLAALKKLMLRVPESLRIQQAQGLQPH
jgi:hypothetical protein